LWKTGRKHLLPLQQILRFYICFFSQENKLHNLFGAEAEISIWPEINSYFSLVVIPGRMLLANGSNGQEMLLQLAY